MGLDFQLQMSNDGLQAFELSSVVVGAGFLLLNECSEALQSAIILHIVDEVQQIGTTRSFELEVVRLFAIPFHHSGLFLLQTRITEWTGHQAFRESHNFGGPVLHLLNGLMLIRRIRRHHIDGGEQTALQTHL